MSTNLDGLAKMLGHMAGFDFARPAGFDNQVRELGLEPNGIVWGYRQDDPIGGAPHDLLREFSQKMLGNDFYMMVIRNMLDTEKHLKREDPDMNPTKRDIIVLKELRDYLSGLSLDD